MADIRDPEIALQIHGFCGVLNDELMRFQLGMMIDTMYVEVREDEAYLEWIFDNFRFGFSFHHDVGESYWFLVERDPTESSRRYKGDFKAGFVEPVRYVLDYIRDHA